MFSDQHRGSLLAIASGLCYGLVGYFGVRIIEENFSVSLMLFWRFFVATVFVGALLIPQYKQIPLDRQALKAFSYGMLFYGVSTTLYFVASEYIGTGVAMVIFFTFPAWVMVINRIFFKSTIPKV